MAAQITHGRRLRHPRPRRAAAAVHLLCPSSATAQRGSRLGPTSGNPRNAPGAGA